MIYSNVRANMSMSSQPFPPIISTRISLLTDQGNDIDRQQYDHLLYPFQRQPAFFRMSSIQLLVSGFPISIRKEAGDPNEAGYAKVCTKTEQVRINGCQNSKCSEFSMPQTTQLEKKNTSMAHQWCRCWYCAILSQHTFHLILDLRAKVVNTLQSTMPKSLSPLLSRVQVQCSNHLKFTSSFFQKLVLNNHINIRIS